MKIFLASDHGGFELKNTLRRYLLASGHEVIDLGPKEYINEDDYPDYFIPAMQEMEKFPYAKGILICRNGVGASLVANRFKHIRATLSWNAVHAKTSKLDDHTNVLALPADFISENNAKEIVDMWLTTDFSNAERHLRRLKKLEEI